MCVLRSIAKIATISEMAGTRPGQVYGSWSESDKSANQMYICNERSVSKIKPAPTNVNLYRYGCILRAYPKNRRLSKHSHIETRFSG